ncbi:DNA polymerase-3 subunit gamma/tau [Dyadobacter sp. BE34]|uniref:DNA polymerase III subunit gamma/tau n=1 Tax=Dyadobacter fermentans TaxID=94254 RepID=A0ABU1QS21_9BACT|nr:MULTISPECIES: DNA polymerase III subunit gamma/tau [Dyadobacter]MDR6803931.1 DNA polymerase-3 subunit gamma/tau [Dyadobacter fermentans]MDR7041671.1 DNA polymerase-3 subunit gamma/tau [Dyadobacter sp. BE242]MDR7196074.1 DNA polymerase-3 subunit gamma/tau [Dyadobacter sp. BE34]MDR7213381.1 DNA polymerase-3 subunit gamma/tau [Dyadobacter sp. BE31]MDR7261480.1 DNA polymerase-3 subunit gamma/tau [Dyadobacter sp. BE32]
MDHFVVSARKYRPVTFDSVVGQSHITTTLKNAIRTNHLAQAFLFCGPRGVGKTTCARILAKTINCQNLGDDVEACGECESCVSFQNNASFNIHELDAASNNSVEDIRNLIDQVRYPPQTGKYKIYIIDEVHMLSQAAFNAFLKTLEEPPSYAIFILATTEKHKILPTILSRCQIFDFNRIQSKDIAHHLADIAKKEGINAEHEALELIGQKADGGLRDALSMFDLNVTFSTNNHLTYAVVLENLHILDYDYYFKITDALTAGSIARSLVLFDEILRKGFDGHLFVIGLLEHFRNLLVCKDPATVTLLQVSESAERKYLEQSLMADLSFLLSALSITGQCDINYKSAKNQRLHVELCLMKLANLPQVLQLQSLAAVDETAKKKVEHQQPLNNPAAPSQAAAPQPAAPPNGQSNGSAYANAPIQPVAAPQQATPQQSAPQQAAPSRLKSTVSLTQSLTPPAQQTTKQSNAEPSVDYAAVPNGAKREELTLANLQRFWYEFSQKRLQAGNSTTEQITLNREIQLNGTTIEIALDNDHQQDAVMNMRYELLGFLKARMDAPKLDINPRVAPQEVNRLPYTPAEKFNFLAEKNPYLLELKQALGLDVDF